MFDMRMGIWNLGVVLWRGVDISLLHERVTIPDCTVLPTLQFPSWITYSAIHGLHESYTTFIVLPGTTSTMCFSKRWWNLFILRTQIASVSRLTRLPLSNTEGIIWVQRMNVNIWVIDEEGFHINCPDNYSNCTNPLTVNDFVSARITMIIIIIENIDSNQCASCKQTSWGKITL